MSVARLDPLPLDRPDTRSRARSAACRGLDVDVFFPEQHDHDGWAAALAICDGCPVREECLAYALDAEEQAGVWGGTGPDERLRLRRRRLAMRRRQAV